MKVSREKIISAAIKYKVNEIYTLPPPNRHEDICKFMLRNGVSRLSQSLNCTEGFFTDARRFVSRHQAYRIAQKADQILPSQKDIPGLSLTTLHLW